MSQTVENLISKLRELELEEKKIRAIKLEIMAKMKDIDQQLDHLSNRRSMALKELEMVYSSDQSEIEFQSLSSENSFYPKSSDIDSDEFTQKRKERSDSTGSDFEIKRVKSTDKDLDKQLQSLEDVNAFDQQMVNKCIDEMAFSVIKEINNSDHQLKDEFEKLCRDPEFESLVKDVEKTKRREMLTQTTPSLCRSYSTDGNFKENVAPSTRVRRTSSNRFRFDQQNSSVNNKSNQNVISQPIILPSKLLKGKKLLSSLLSEKQTIDEKREKCFTETVETISKDFKKNFSFWEKKTTECLLQQNKRNSKVVSV